MHNNFDRLVSADLLTRVEEFKSSADAPETVQRAQKFDLNAFLEKIEQQFDTNAGSGVGDTATAPPFSRSRTYGQQTAGSTLLQHAEEQAAVSGKFSPEELAFADASDEDRQSVLSALVKECSVEATDAVRWIMLRGRRVDILTRLAAAEELLRVLAGPLPPTDAFGDLLRQVLEEGSNYSFESLQREKTIALINVLETLGDTGLPLPDMQAVKEHACAMETAASYEVLSRNFVGREAQLARLSAFLNTVDDVHGSDWRGLVVGGAGGAGKSTLLAKFVGDTLAQSNATVVWLDFDRPGISAVDTMWLDREISRQVGRQYISAHAHLRELRAGLNEDQFDPFSKGYTGLETSRHSYSLLDEVQWVIVSAGAEKKPLLLVLDTVEEVVQAANTGHLVEWIHSIRNAFYRLNLKVIFSGRLFDDQLAQLGSIAQVDDPIEVDAFEQSVAISFLEMEGLDAQTAEAVTQLDGMPLRPLQLKLVAKVLADGKTTIADLKDDLRTVRKTATTDDLFAGLVYRRVLQRIRNPLVRQLAYPGLLLRYLNAEILREVLLPVLRDPALRKMGEAELAALMDQFGSYAWLAERDANGAFWHRKDLRRSMLRLMMAAEPEKVAEIRKAAVAFFDRRKDEAARAESLYHRLMDATSPSLTEGFNKHELEIAYPVLSAYITDLPKPAAVLLQYCGTRKISDADLPLLPHSLFSEAYERVAKRLVDQRNFGLAHQLLEEATKLDPAKAELYAANRNAEMLLYATCNWEKTVTIYRANRHPPREKVPVFELYNFLFPRALLAIETVNIQVLETLLRRVAKEKSSYKRLAGERGPLILLQMACALLALDNRGFLSEGCKKSVQGVAKTFEEDGSWSGSRELFILFSIGTGDSDREAIRFRPAGLRLNDEWLEELRGLALHKKSTLANAVRLIGRRLDLKDVNNDPEAKRLLNEQIMRPLRGKPQKSLLTQVQELVVASPLSSKQLLTKLDGNKELREQLASTFWSLPRTAPRQVFELLRGPYPFLRDPCRYALMEAFQSKEDLRQLAGFIQRALPFRLTDLKPSAFSALMADNYEHALEPFVEIIDRCWSLGEFLKHINTSSFATEKTRAVHHVYKSLDAALQELTGRNY